MTNWSDLPQDAVVSIAKHIDFFEDFLAARGVDRSWRSAAIKINFTGLSMLYKQKKKNARVSRFLVQGRMSFRLNKAAAHSSSSDSAKGFVKATAFLSLPSSSFIRVRSALLSS
ncbi:hypothetical protein M0R45_000552 [Rubus argutus]|uniref:F-box domain-containing protein n=1 Tax=Rubus argutus TaxID=59490 RepID=A0AAW1VQB6_RUBAR